jgi:hypothetical protein
LIECKEIVERQWPRRNSCKFATQTGPGGIADWGNCGKAVERTTQHNYEKARVASFG